MQPSLLSLYFIPLYIFLYRQIARNNLTYNWHSPCAEAQVLRTLSSFFRGKNVYVGKCSSIERKRVYLQYLASNVQLQYTCDASKSSKGTEYLRGHVRVRVRASKSPFRLMVRTSPFHGGNGGSIPPKDKVIMMVKSTCDAWKLCQVTRVSVFLIGGLFPVAVCTGVLRVFLALVYQLLRVFARTRTCPRSRK